MTDQSQLRQMGLFDARVPRYASYPTAPTFSDRVGAAQMSQWLTAVPKGSAVSLYVHVPFCRRLCWFCASRTQGTASGQPVQAYVDSLLAEVRLVARHLPDGLRLSRLHWGGGTPTLLSPSQIARLADAIDKVLPFDAGHEFSVEIDPNEIDDARLDALAAAGMTRASVGVQDFDPLIQTAIGRNQSFEITQGAVEGLRARGIGGLDMDLLYGLPFQTVERIEAGTRQVLSLRPDRLALYGYAHVPSVARRQAMIPVEALPDPESRLVLAEAAARLLSAAGYQPIGIDHFGLPQDALTRAAVEKRLRRNFQGYTDDAAPVLIGLGASAISRFPQGYAQNAAATAAYQGAVRGNRLAVTRGHAFQGDDVLRGRIIEALMCDFSADLGAIAERCGVPGQQARALARGLDSAFPGATRMHGSTLTITPEARVAVRLIARHFDAFAATKAGYSAAI
jgi:oxygen-independent coproporphyrinogen-3 oxidase